MEKIVKTNPNSVQEKKSSLFLACESKQTKIIDTLLHEGFYLNIQEIHNNKTCLQALLAEPYYTGYQHRDNPEDLLPTERSLLNLYNKGADITHDEHDVIEIAFSRNYQTLINQFIDNTPLSALQNLTFKLSLGEKTNLFNLASHFSRTKVLEKLLGKGWSIDYQDHNGKSAIFFCKNQEMINFFIQKNCNLLLQDIFGSYPISCCNNIVIPEEKKNALAIFKNIMKKHGIEKSGITLETLSEAIVKNNNKAVFKNLFNTSKVDVNSPLKDGSNLLIKSLISENKNALSIASFLTHEKSALWDRSFNDIPTIAYFFYKISQDLRLERDKINAHDLKIFLCNNRVELFTGKNLKKALEGLYKVLHNQDLVPIHKHSQKETQIKSASYALSHFFVSHPSFINDDPSWLEEFNKIISTPDDNYHFYGDRALFKPGEKQGMTSIVNDSLLKYVIAHEPKNLVNQMVNALLDYTESQLGKYSNINVVNRTILVEKYKLIIGHLVNSGFTPNLDKYAHFLNKFPEFKKLMTEEFENKLFKINNNSLERKSTKIL